MKVENNWVTIIAKAIPPTGQTIDIKTVATINSEPVHSYANPVSPNSTNPKQKLLEILGKINNGNVNVQMSWHITDSSWTPITLNINDPHLRNWNIKFPSRISHPPIDGLEPVLERVSGIGTVSSTLSIAELEQILSKETSVEEITQYDNLNSIGRNYKGDPMHATGRDPFEIACNNSLERNEGWDNNFIPELRILLSLPNVGNASNKTLLEKYRALLKKLDIPALPPEYQQAIADAYAYSSPGVRMEGYEDLISTEELEAKKNILAKAGFSDQCQFSLMRILEYRGPFENGSIYSKNHMETILKNLAPTNQGQENLTLLAKLKLASLTTIKNWNVLRLANSCGNVRTMYADGKWRTVVTGYISRDPRDPSARGEGIEGRYNKWSQIFLAMQKKYASEGKTLKVITREMMESLGNEPPWIHMPVIGSPYMLDHHRINGAVGLGLAMEVTGSKIETFN